jgi:hypothetical protein
MHDCCPDEQLLVQVKPHMALGALPVHTWGDVHDIVPETKRQALASVAQVATVCESWHTVPVCVQIDESQAHPAAVPVTVHDWCGPHFIVGTHAVQPLACAWQVSTPAVPQRVAPAVHALVQHIAWPAAPVHAPFAHGVMADLKTQPWLSVEQVASVVALWHVAPAMPQVASVLQEQPAPPATPVQLWFVPHALGVP